MINSRLLSPILLLALLLAAAGLKPAMSQDVEVDLGLREGLAFRAPDEGIGMAFNLRMQQQVSMFSGDMGEQGLAPQFSTVSRRNRFTFSGYVNDGQMSFLFMPSLDRGQAGLELAYFNWRVDEQTKLTFGQIKVPLTREFLISSGNLSMVDRSFVDSRFRQLYDIGIQVKHTLAFDSSVLNLTGAITSGEGGSQPTREGGYSYTARAEWMPWGKFDAYLTTDVSQSDQPRLALAAAANYNHDAHRAGGSVGRFLGSSANRINLATYSLDGMYKQNGLSVLAQINHRRVDGANPYTAFEGSGYVFQSGYMMSDKTEISARHGYYWPSTDLEAAFQEQRRWVVGWSRYMNGHDLKIQADLGIIEHFGATPAPDQVDILGRMLFQLDF